MSYDLEIYTNVAAGPDDLVRLIESTGHISPVVGDDGAIIEVVDKRSRDHVFSIDGPFGVEREDFMFEATGSGCGSVLYQIVVRASDDRAVGLARRLALRLVDELGGCVIDPQADQQRPEVTRAAAPPGSSLEMAWYRLRDGSPMLAEAYLSSARHLLPAALPARFGTHDPLKGRFPRDADREFIDTYRRECAVSNLWLRGTIMGSGYITGWTDELRTRYQLVRLSFDFSELEGVAQPGDIRTFFLEVAKRSNSFHAWAQLTTDPNDANGARHFEGGWSGLTGDIRWLSWYDPSYAALVRPHLTTGFTASFPEGVLHQLTGSPLEAMTIATDAGDLPSLPADFQPIMGADGKVVAPAVKMPSSLRRPEPGSPEAERIEATIARNRLKGSRLP